MIERPVGTIESHPRVDGNQARSAHDASSDIAHDVVSGQALVGGEDEQG